MRLEKLSSARHIRFRLWHSEPRTCPTLEGGGLRAKSESSKERLKERSTVIFHNGDEDVGVVKVIERIDFLADVTLRIHIAPQSEEDINTIFNSLSFPPVFPSLGDYGDLIRIDSVKIVDISDAESEHTTDLPCYAPAGTERHNAIKRFEGLKKQYPGAEHVKEIEKARWER